MLFVICIGMAFMIYNKINPLPFLVIILWVYILIVSIRESVTLPEPDPIKVVREIGTTGEVIGIDKVSSDDFEIIRGGSGYNLITVSNDYKRIIDVKYDEKQCQIKLIQQKNLFGRFNLFVNPKVANGKKISLIFITKGGKELPLELIVNKQDVQEVKFNGLQEWYPSVYTENLEIRIYNNIMKTVKGSLEPYLWLIEKISPK